MDEEGDKLYTWETEYERTWLDSEGVCYCD